MLVIIDEFIDFIKAGGTDDDVLPLSIEEEPLRAD